MLSTKYSHYKHYYGRSLYDGIPHTSTLRAIFHTPPLSEPYTTHLYSQRTIFNTPPLSEPYTTHPTLREPYSTHLHSQSHISHTPTLREPYSTHLHSQRRLQSPESTHIRAGNGGITMQLLDVPRTLHQPCTTPPMHHTLSI